MNRLRVVWFAILLLGLLLDSSLQAQRITGDLTGDVTDSTGALLPNVTVKVESKDTGQVRTATTSGAGNYRVPELAIGTYKVTATAPGFKSVVQTIQIMAGAVAQASFKLPVGETSETIEVQGAAPLVELSPNENNYVDSEKIENVPLNGRDFNSLLAITPGVQRAPGGGFLAVSINGSRTTSNNYFIDGLYNNDRYYGDSAIGETGILGIPAVLFPPEAIEEMSVQETPSAEFGVKGGAPILLNMKSGTNNWHGSGTWVNHNGLGDANNYFANHNPDNCAQPGECRPTPIHNNQMNATIGGPLVKDKAFLFVYYEGQRYISTSVAARTVPTPDDVANAEADIGPALDPVGAKLLSYFPTSPTGTIIQHTPTTASANGFGVKFDYKINPSNSLSVRYIFGDSLQSSAPFAGLPPSPAYPQDLFNSVAASRAQMAGVSWTTNFGNNKILESRLGYTRFAQLLGINNKIDPKSLGVDTGPLSPADFGVPYVYMYHLGYGGYIGGVQGYPIVTRPDATWDWSEHFSWVKGNHTIKLGGNYQRGTSNSIRNNARTGLAVGYFSYYAPIYAGNYPAPGVQQDVEQLLLGKADLADRDFGDTHRHIYQNSVGFYAQDDWKIKPRLTLSYGLRWEINGTMRDTANREANFIPGRGLVQVGNGIGGIHNVDYKDFAPHLGFAWDVFGTGRMAVRGGYSLTFDVPNFAAFASPYSFAHAHTGVFDQPNLGVFSVSNLSDVAGDAGSLLPPNNAGASCYDPADKAGDYICFDSATNGPVFGADPTGTPPFNVFSVVNNFKTPRYHNFNLSLQNELFHNNVLTVTYSGQRGRDLLIYHDLNASPIGSLSVANPGTVCSSPSDCDPKRPFHGLYVDANGNDLFQHVIQASNDAHSQYDSLQVSYNQRAWHGLDTQYNLTWSKCYDENSVNRGGSGDYPQLNNVNPVGSTAPAVANFADSRGLCDHDVRLNFNIGGVYNVPQIPHLGVYAGKGWQFGTVLTAISGRPFSALLTGNDNSGQGLIGSSIRAAWDGTPLHYNTRNPDNYVTELYTNPGQPDPCGNVSDSGGLPLSPFYQPCNGIGNSRRNQAIGPGLVQWDMSLSKTTRIGERVDVELRWEVYNILNHGNFYYIPNNILSSCAANVVANHCTSVNGANFGQINETSDVAAGNPVIAQGGPRNMNFVLKFRF